MTILKKIKTFFKKHYETVNAGLTFVFSLTMLPFLKKNSENIYKFDKKLETLLASDNEEMIKQSKVELAAKIYRNLPPNPNSRDSYNDFAEKWEKRLKGIYFIDYLSSDGYVLTDQPSLVTQIAHRLGNIFSSQEKVVLFTEAAYDPTNALKTLDLDIFDSFKDKYPIYHLKAQSHKEINQFVQTLKANNKVVQLHVHAVHGNPHTMHMGNYDSKLGYQELPVQDYAEDATIVLMSCSTGRAIESGDNVAEIIAKMAGPNRKVISANKLAYGSHLYLKDAETFDFEFNAFPYGPNYTYKPNLDLLSAPIQTPSHIDPELFPMYGMIRHNPLYLLGVGFAAVLPFFVTDVYQAVARSIETLKLTPSWLRLSYLRFRNPLVSLLKKNKLSELTEALKSASSEDIAEAFHVAISKSNKDAIKIILENAAIDLNKTHLSYNTSPLEHAIRTGNYEVFLILAEHCNHDFKKEHLLSCHYKKAPGTSQILNHLLAHFKLANSEEINETLQHAYQAGMFRSVFPVYAQYGYQYNPINLRNTLDFCSQLLFPITTGYLAPLFLPPQLLVSQLTTSLVCAGYSLLCVTIVKASGRPHPLLNFTEAVLSIFSNPSTSEPLVEPEKGASTDAQIKEGSNLLSFSQGHALQGQTLKEQVKEKLKETNSPSKPELQSTAQPA